MKNHKRKLTVWYKSYRFFLPENLLKNLCSLIFVIYFCGAKGSPNGQCATRGEKEIRWESETVPAAVSSILGGPHARSSYYDIENMFNRTLCHWRPSRWEGAMERNKSEDLPCVLVDLDLQVYGLRIKTIFYPYFITHKSIATLRRIACRPKVNPNPSFWRTLPLPWYAEKEFWVDNLITCTQAD